MSNKERSFRKPLWLRRIPTSGDNTISFSWGLDGGKILCKIQNHAFQGNELSVNSSETVSLNCSVIQGGPAKQITWTKKGAKANSQRLFPISSTSVPGLWSSLQLGNISVEDSGRYQCDVKTDRKRHVCEVVLHVYCKSHMFNPTTPSYILQMICTPDFVKIENTYWNVILNSIHQLACVIINRS